MSKPIIFIERGEIEDLQVELTFSYVAPSRGHRDRYGAPEEPDESGYVDEITANVVGTGEEIELTKEERDKAEKKINEFIAEGDPDADALADFHSDCFKDEEKL